MLVRWLCSSPASELYVKWVCKPRSSPASGNAPLGKKGVREPTGCVQGRLKQVCPGGLAVTGLGKECTLLTSRRSVRKLLDLHFHRGPRPESSGIRWGRPAERQKKQRQRQATNPEENRQRDNLQITKLGDDQERRANWRKTKGRELLSSTKKKNAVEEDSQESPTAKTCSSYEKKPARIKKYQKNRDSF